MFERTEGSIELFVGGIDQPPFFPDGYRMVW